MPLYLYGVPTVTNREQQEAVVGGGGGFGYVTSPWHSLADVHKGPDIVLRTLKATGPNFDRIDVVRAASDGFAKLRISERIATLPAAVRSRHDRDADALLGRMRRR